MTHPTPHSMISTTRARGVTSLILVTITVMVISGFVGANHDNDGTACKNWLTEWFSWHKKKDLKNDGEATDSGYSTPVKQDPELVDEVDTAQPNSVDVVVESAMEQPALNNTNVDAVPDVLNNADAHEQIDQVADDVSVGTADVVDDQDARQLVQDVVATLDQFINDIDTITAAIDVHENGFGSPMLAVSDDVVDASSHEGDVDSVPYYTYHPDYDLLPTIMEVPEPADDAEVVVLKIHDDGVCCFTQQGQFEGTEVVVGQFVDDCVVNDAADPIAQQAIVQAVEEILAESFMSYELVDCVDEVNVESRNDVVSEVDEYPATKIMDQHEKTDAVETTAQDQMQTTDRCLEESTHPFDHPISEPELPKGAFNLDAAEFVPSFAVPSYNMSGYEYPNTMSYGYDNTDMTDYMSLDNAIIDYHGVVANLSTPPSSSSSPIPDPSQFYPGGEFNHDASGSFAMQSKSARSLFTSQSRKGLGHHQSSPPASDQDMHHYHEDGVEPRSNEQPVRSTKKRHRNRRHGQQSTRSVEPSRSMFTLADHIDQQSLALMANSAEPSTPDNATHEHVARLDDAHGHVSSIQPHSSSRQHRKKTSKNKIGLSTTDDKQGAADQTSALPCFYGASCANKSNGCRYQHPDVIPKHYG